MGEYDHLSYNGSAVIAMKGKDCVAIASDRRYGIQAQTLADNMQKIFQMCPYLFVGMSGIASDAKTIYERLRFRVNLYELRENRAMRPKTLASVLSNLLYEKRFGFYMVQPLVAGLDPITFQPFVCNMDLIGCISQPEDFVVGGTCSEQLFGMCEALYRPDMKPDELFETISQALMNAFDRDALSGWGAEVVIVEKDKVTTRTLRTRMD